MGASESRSQGNQQSDVEDYYTLLGVDENATGDEIKVRVQTSRKRHELTRSPKKAFRKLALTHHPDKAGSTPLVWIIC
jgi:DnaJ-class molecular chaperone